MCSSDLACKVLAGLAFGLESGTDFTAGVSGVVFVHDIQKWCKIIICRIGTVNSVIYCNKTDIFLREHHFTIIDKSTKRIGTVGINPSDFPFNFYLFICCPDDRYQCVHHLPLVLKADILPVIQIPGNAFHLLHRHSVRREFCNLIGNGLPPCVQLLNFAVGIGEQNRACARQRVKQLFNLAFYLCQFQPLCSQFRGDFCSLVPTCQIGRASCRERV